MTATSPEPASAQGLGGRPLPLRASLSIGDLVRRLAARRVMLPLLGVFLAWQIVTVTLVAYLAEVDPQLALRLSPGDPVALLNAVDRRLQQAANEATQSLKASGGAADSGLRLPTIAGDEIVSLRAMVQRALGSEPLSARAHRLLGQLSALSGEEAAVTRHMEMAARLSLHETTAVYWMLLESFRRKDYERAITFADVMLRTRPDTVETVVPVLTRLAEQPAARGKMKSILALDPPWRAQFFAGMLAHLSDPRAPLDMMLALKDTPAPATRADLRAYLDYLAARELNELAYFTWLQFLPAGHLGEAGFLFNGHFRFPASDMPFDWTLLSGAGADIDIVGRPDGGNGDRALRIRFGEGRIDLGSVSQRLVLPEGRYVLGLSYKGEVRARRGLKWSLACSTSREMPLVESEPFTGTQRDWRRLELAFEVPATGCSAQVLRLFHDSRSASEQFVAGEAWYDEIEIARSRR